MFVLVRMGTYLDFCCQVRPCKVISQCSIGHLDTLSCIVVDQSIIWQIANTLDLCLCLLQSTFQSVTCVCWCPLNPFLYCCPFGILGHVPRVTPSQSTFRSKFSKVWQRWSGPIYYDTRLFNFHNLPNLTMKVNSTDDFFFKYVLFY